MVWVVWWWGSMDSNFRWFSNSKRHAVLLVIAFHLLCHWRNSSWNLFKHWWRRLSTTFLFINFHNEAKWNACLTRRLCKPHFRSGDLSDTSGTRPVTDWCMGVGRRSNFPKAAGIQKCSPIDGVPLFNSNLFEPLQIYVDVSIYLFFFFFVPRRNCWSNDVSSAV